MRKKRPEQGVSLVPFDGYGDDEHKVLIPGVPIPEGRVGAKLRKLDFESIIGRGENITGFESQTVNGTGRAGNNPGHNQEYKFNMPEASKRVPWKNGNRSGE